jgi:hypothetical protein
MWYVLVRPHQKLNITFRQKNPFLLISYPIYYCTMSNEMKPLEDRIQDAISAYHQKKIPQMSVLAREFEVPYHLLRARMQGQPSKFDRAKNSRTLDPIQEQEMLSYIDSLDNSYTSPTPELIEKAANRLLKKAGSDRLVGHNWAYRFLKRLSPRFNYLTQKPKGKSRIDSEHFSALHMANETETQDTTTAKSIEWPTSAPEGTSPPTEPPSHPQKTNLQSQSGAVPSVIKGWYVPTGPWAQLDSPSTPSTPTTSQIASQTPPTAGETASLTRSQVAGQTPIQMAGQSAGQSAGQMPKVPRASPLSNEDDLELLRIAVYYKDRFTSMKSNAALYEVIAEIWRANTGRNISHQTVHKHVTDRLKEHAAILAIPEASRARMNTLETAIFDYANEIYEVLQHNLVADERRKELARAGTKPQTHANSVQNDMADEIVQQRGRNKRPRDSASSSYEGM